MDDGDDGRRSPGPGEAAGRSRPSARPIGAGEAQRRAIAAYSAALLEPGQRLLIASNRGPLTFAGGRGEWRVRRGSGGLVTALAELGRLAPLTWVCAAWEAGDRQAAEILAQGGSAAAELGHEIAMVLPGQDLELRLSPLPAEPFRAHYGVVANPFLWFIQHEMYALPYAPIVDDRLLAAWRNGYRVVNSAMAERVVSAADGRRPVALLQDYHLYLAAAEIRRRRPDSLLLHFTHIPWPPASRWHVLPQGMRREICEGLLGNDIVGFQTDRNAANFLDTVEDFVRDARVDADGRHVRWRGRTISVRAYPVSIDVDRLLEYAQTPPVQRRRAALEARFRTVGDPLVIARADRMEPSKNVLRGLLAFETLLRHRPALHERVRFVMVTSRSREALPEYRAYARAVDEVVGRINQGAAGDARLVWTLDGADYPTVIAVLQRADVVLANVLADGMNLVAKESASVGRGAIVLSETAGAAEQLGDACFLVAPADVTGTAEMLERALGLPPDEREQRRRRLRARVREEDLAWWLARQLRDLVAVSEGRRPPSRQLRDEARRFEPPLSGEG